MGIPSARARRVGGALTPLEDERDLDALLERIGDARCVLLGEASHGTHEYYAWRARLTRRLLAEAGFSFLAVEGDWPDCFQIDRFVKGKLAAPSAAAALGAFARWPTWMWANREVAELVAWLKAHNDAQPADRKAGFFGLDVYSLWTSLSTILAHLGRRDSDALEAAREAFLCFEPYGEDEHAYARATLLVPQGCEDEVVALLSAVLGRPREPGEDEAERFSLEQNAAAVVGAERYYRTMVRGDRTSWNVRDSHMVDTLDRLLELHGPRSRAVVWAHNTHVGDARATPMAAAGMHNIGQLVRARHADEGVFIVGFDGHRGDVIAGRWWGAPMESMPVPPARRGSIEDLLHEGAGRDGVLFPADVEDDLGEPIGHRAIGVVYDPDRGGSYVPSLLPLRYDALIHFEETRALAPLRLPERREPEPPETFPVGV